MTGTVTVPDRSLKSPEPPRREAELRVALLVNNLGVGGAQEVVRTLAKYLESNACKPCVCSLFDGGPLLHNLQQQGTYVEVLGLNRRPVRALPWYLSDMKRMWSQLARFFREQRINVVQTNNCGSQDFLILALARRMRIPVAAVAFQNERFLPTENERGLQSRMHRLGYRLMRRWADEYIAVSAKTKESMHNLLGLPDDDIKVICNAVDVSQYDEPVDGQAMRGRLGLDAQTTLLITVGRLVRQKGHCYLIDAASKIAAKHPNAHFLLVGDGELRPELERQVEHLGLSNRIHFLGTRRDVTELLAASDVFVLPSLWEGLSVALLEAMAAGKPIIASEVSGTVQTIHHGESGILVPPDDAGALAGAIDDLLSSPPAEVQALGANSRRRVIADFSAEKQAREFVDLYRHLLAASTGTSVT